MIRIIVGVFGTVPKSLKSELEIQTISEIRPNSRRREETCSYSDFRVKKLTGVKHLRGSKMNKRLKQIRENACRIGHD